MADNPAEGSSAPWSLTCETPHVSLALLLPRDAVSIPIVRHLCEHALSELGCVPECAEDVGLAVTEACANVIKHAGPGESYTVDVAIQSEFCEMRVIDSAGLFIEADAAASTRARAADEMSESGRGLAIIAALTDHLSFEARPENGTLVRMVKQLEFDEESPARQLMVLSSTRPT